MKCFGAAVYAFDRDGTVIGSLSDYESNHPKHIKCPDDMRLIAPVVNFINSNGAIIISNQDGPSTYAGHESIADCMGYLMDSIPGLHACFWSERDEQGQDGMLMRIVYRVNGSALELDTILCGSSCRKPSPLMAIAAKDMGFQVSHYVGDLSGDPAWGQGKDSDRQFAQNSGLKYTDVKDFIQSL